ncbi:hypothetical protein B0H17DRAFT_1208655 [Mycena rosella]|uniref:Uncharacterized protein n=1 Tax=Mycena rosella TaxID=1033263 RepID=A0AAD7GB26_MYCRO|nr:hypothetical protein B0H17DRAFT_1208655 [Mycena rosella]
MPTPSPHPESEYGPVLDVAAHALSTQPVLRKLPLPKRASLALDLTLIALACRPGWLVDAVAVQDAERIFADLLRILQGTHPLFAGVQHLFDPGSQQSFFVNTALASAADIAADVAFVSLRPNHDPQLLPAPPPAVLAALRALRTTHALPPALTPHTLISLAAVLLGYPVAYAPAADAAAAPFLAQTPLDVYTCAVRPPDAAWEHTLLKFSCPAGLADAGLAPAHIAATLDARFGPRVRGVGLVLRVGHTTEVMDRVAL